MTARPDTVMPLWVTAPPSPAPSADCQIINAWIEDAYRLLLRLSHDIDRRDTQALGRKVQEKMAAGITPSDFLDYRLTVPAKGADEVELLVECGLSWILAAKACMQNGENFAAMSHLIAAYHAIGFATPIAVDVAARRERAEAQWSEFLSAVRQILMKRGKPNKWRSVSHAANFLAVEINKAYERTQKKPGKQGTTALPVELVKKWGKRGGPLHAEFQKHLSSLIKPGRSPSKSKLNHAPQSSRGLRLRRIVLGFPDGAK